MPAIDSAASVAIAKVIGINLRKPPRRRMSRVCVSWSMMPADMNSAALKVAWFRMWNIAAIAPKAVPVPSSMVMRPRWLTVEKARRAFKSCLNSAITAPKTMVIRPAVVTITNHSGVPDNTGHIRAMRKMPAFTIVAECR